MISFSAQGNVRKLHKTEKKGKEYLCLIQIIQPTRCNSFTKFITRRSYVAQHVSGISPPIIRSIRLHLEPLVLPLAGSGWRVVGRGLAGYITGQTTTNNAPSVAC